MIFPPVPRRALLRAEVARGDLLRVRVRVRALTLTLTLTLTLILTLTLALTLTVTLTDLLRQQLAARLVAALVLVDQRAQRECEALHVAGYLAGVGPALRQPPPKAIEVELRAARRPAPRASGVQPEGGRTRRCGIGRGPSTRSRCGCLARP